MRNTENSNLRADTRYRVHSGKIPGRIYAADKAVQLQATSFDISKSGLGLVVDEMLAPGERIWLITDQVGVKFEVRHCGPKSGVSGFLCGLALIDSSEAIDDLFAAAGIF